MSYALRNMTHALLCIWGNKAKIKSIQHILPLAKKREQEVVGGDL